MAPTLHPFGKGKHRCGGLGTPKKVVIRGIWYKALRAVSTALHDSAAAPLFAPARTAGQCITRLVRVHKRLFFRALREQNRVC